MMKIQEILMEQGAETYYAFGKFYGRGDTESVKVKFPSAIVLKYIKLAKKDWEDAEEFVDGFKNHTVGSAIESMFGEEKNFDEIERFIQAGKSFNSSIEEFAFGYGTTPAEAKNQFLKIDDDEEDKWDE